MLTNFILSMCHEAHLLIQTHQTALPNFYHKYVIYSIIHYDIPT